MRRQCQAILPGLYLGPLQASKSLEILQSLGVTHMCVPHLCSRAPACGVVLTDRLVRLCRVCIRDAKEAFSVRPRFEGKFKYMVLDVQDSEEQNLIRLFPQCVHPLSLTLCGALQLSL